MFAALTSGDPAASRCQPNCAQADIASTSGEKQDPGCSSRLSTQLCLVIEDPLSSNCWACLFFPLN